MRIQHNIMAMNAYRNYNTNTSALSKNLEKLSSGYKINRAGDDAAGLAISEKMRAQITGLEAAQKNVKDGISLVKTAEGAMQEIQDMLNRMDYLATQSANGTYDNEVDRANLQKEVEALKTEIDRIADSANFNGIKLLDGSMSNRAAGSRSSVVEGADRIIKTVIGEGDKPYEVFGNKTILDEVGVATASAGAFQINLEKLSVSYSGTATDGTVGFKLTIGGVEVEFQATGVTATDTASAVLAKLKFKAGSMGTFASKATATASLISLNDVDWKVEYNAGKMTFTMNKAPTSASQCQTNFDLGNVTAVGSTTSLGNSTNVGVYTSTVAKAKGAGNAANTVFRIDESDIVDGAKITIGTRTITLAVGPDSKYKDQVSASDVADLTSMAADKIDLNRALQSISNALGSTVGAEANGVSVTLNVGVNDGSNGGPVGITVQRATIATAATQVAFKTLDDLASVFKLSKTQTWGKSDGLTLQIGDTAESYNQLNVSVNDMHTDALGISGLDISNQTDAAAAIETIRNAINQVSSTRGDLGAVQNRLEHTANNLSVMAENIQDAESTIRDTDVAEEMMAYTKNNILIQSAQAMLAQANQVPQGVLQLLQ